MPSDTDTYDEYEDLVTTAEACQIFRVSRSTIHRAIKSDKLHPLRTPGGHLRFRRADIEKMLGGAEAAS